MVQVQHLLLLHRRTLVTVRLKSATLVFQSPHLLIMSPYKLLPTPYLRLRKMTPSSLHLSPQPECFLPLFCVFLTRGLRTYPRNEQKTEVPFLKELFHKDDDDICEAILWVFLNSLGFHSLSACKNYKVPPSALALIQRYPTDEKTPSPPSTSAD